MTRFFKTLLLWLLLVALPLQGIAAVEQVACGPAEHHSSTQVAISAHHHDGGESGLSFDAGNDVASVMMSQMASVHSHDIKHKHTTCSSCASCCVSAVAPPSTLILTPARTDSLAVLVSSSPLVTDFIPAGLERPPKRITA